MQKSNHMQLAIGAVLVVFLMFVSYIVNIVKIVGGFSGFGEMSGEMLIRLVGIVLLPVGVVMGCVPG